MSISRNELLALDPETIERWGMVDDLAEARRDQAQAARTSARWNAQPVERADGRRPGRFGSVLDPDALLAAGRAAYLAAHPDADPEFITHGPGPQMLFTVDAERTPAVVNREGVGATADGDTVAVWLDVYATWTAVDVPVRDVHLAATAEVVDLADGIREGGRRQDENHATWTSLHRS